MTPPVLPVLAVPLLLAPLLAAAPVTTPVVVPVSQTRAFADDPAASPANSDADDPAIWVNRRSPARSVVLGTLKEGGLAAFDLAGATLGTWPAPAAPTPDAAPGRFNNVDVLSGVRVGGQRRDLAFVTDRGRDRVRVHEVDARGADARGDVLTDVTDPAARPVFSSSEAEVDEQRTVYGLAAGTDRVTGTPLVLVTRRHETRVALLRVVPGRDGTVGTRVVSTLDLPSSFVLPDGTTWTPCGEPDERPQLEGVVIDSAHGVAYAAQEDVGVWRVPLRASGFGEPELVDRVRSFGVPGRFDPETEECVADGADPGFGGEHLTADAEGLTIAEGPRGTGQLLVSSQGDSRFVVYDRTGDNAVLGEFAVGAGRGNDSVEHSDGASVVTADLGGPYSRGLLVVHDGEREPAEGDAATTGFAFVAWSDVRRAVRP
ncbi:phytase [Umezawaea beigongshangensis]|uniref:phytase n=1 Tax=Umezawaea beigongshangensis TaxID=2780383 RepID=UPI0018F203BF|nr:phytase [Umezawaea beigongshangensis]